MITVITGSSGGIGAEVVRSLHEQGHRVIHVGRVLARHQAVMRDGDNFVECELSSLASVAHAAAEVRKLTADLDLLVNNAAAAGRRGLTREGFEYAFGVNYLSHYLLTRLLARTRRIVNVSSEAHRGITDLRPFRGQGRTQSLLGFREYQFSKAAQIAFTYALVGRGFEAYCAHPGVIATDLWRRVPWPIRPLLTRRLLPPAAGASPIVRAATDPALNPGDYVTPRGVVAPSSPVAEPGNIDRLWNQSEAWVAAYLN